MPKRPRSTLRRRANWLVRWGGVVVCVVVAGVWVTGERWHLSWELEPRLTLAISSGDVTVRRLPEWSIKGDRISPEIAELFRTGSMPQATRPRVHVPRSPISWSSHGGGVYREWMLTVSLWAPLALTAIVTAMGWGCDIRRHRRSRVGHCPTCDYDLAGLVVGATASTSTTVKCPECGTGGGT